ncbi:hypothetical protein [Halorubrum sp. DTA98]|uniref:hypothetical protein n=1 Tax=Halorubrum sp. DTA98 TaxID=3402163 RepID=UPI003AAE7C08
MDRRAVVLGTLTAVTAGCTDRLHDVAASTPSNIDVRSRYVPDDPLVESESITGHPASIETHVVSFRAVDRATDALAPGSPDVREFVSGTDFVDDGGRFVLLVVQRLTSPAVDLRLGSVSRIGDRALRIAIDEVGTPRDADPVVQTVLVRLADARGPPERVTVSVESDRVSVTI